MDKNKLPGSDPLLGVLVDEKYELERRIGRGGMGTVYAARHTKIDKQVAIKILLSNMVEDPTSFERFKREARALACVNHPNIVSIIDFGQASDDLIYMVIEYVDGVP